MNMSYHYYLRLSFYQSWNAASALASSWRILANNLSCSPLPWMFHPFHDTSTILPRMLYTNTRKNKEPWKMVGVVWCHLELIESAINTLHKWITYFVFRKKQYQCDILVNSIAFGAKQPWVQIPALSLFINDLKQLIKCQFPNLHKY